MVRQVKITPFVHATEDRSKVLKAIQNIFPREIELPPYTETNLEGYYSDPIVLLSFLVKNRKSATEVFNNLIKNLSSLDYVTLLDELLQRMDDTKNLYLRFDKQKAFLGKLVLEHHDSIRVKISLLLPHKVDPVLMLREYMEEIRG